MPLQLRKGPDIAFLTEVARFSGGGITAIVLLCLWNPLMLVVFSMAAKSAVQETAIALVWLIGNHLLGLGVLLGRRRDYIVHRAALDEPSHD